MAQTPLHAGVPPTPPEQQSRERPYTWLPTQHVPRAWAAVARAFNEAAYAWRDELRGTVTERRYQNVRDFAAWRRLRDGRPSQLQRYERERLSALLTPSGRAEIVSRKLRLYAEHFGMLDPLDVSRCSRHLTRSATRAEQLLAVLWEDAAAAASHERALQDELRKTKAALKKLRADMRVR